MIPANCSGYICVVSHKVKGPTSTSKGQHQASGIKRPFCAPPANLHRKQYSSHHSPGPCFQMFPFCCAFQTTKIMINCSPPQTFSASQTFPWMPKGGLGKRHSPPPVKSLRGKPHENHGRYTAHTILVSFTQLGCITFAARRRCVSLCLRLRSYKGMSSDS